MLQIVRRARFACGAGGTRGHLLRQYFFPRIRKNKTLFRSCLCPTASSSCHVPEIKHDVFISFRGSDVRCGLLSHLVKDLRRGHIDAYVDDRLETGDEISSSLIWAIERSPVSLVIFSKDYASSTWCLEELAKIVECMEWNKQIVIPIFYSVDPSDVRHQKGDYGAALAKHEERFKENLVKVQNWRSALNKTAQLSGLHYPSDFKNESDLVNAIVKDVSNNLRKLRLGELDDPSESNGLVGIDQNIVWIKSFLTTETREVLKLGIWGMGGIGKTTIARVAFDTFSSQYEGYCFLENVREELERHQLSYLQEKLVFELLGKENPLINGTGKVDYYTKRMLSRKKVLIVLDDVNTPNLLKDFLEPIRLGPESRVIVTSRDRQVFIAGGFHEKHIRQVKELNFEDSCKLFCLNAFNDSQPKMGYEDLSKRAIAIAKGNPLALKVFGSHLHSKSKDIWECTLEKLKKHPDQNIQRVLRLSYDGLDDLEKKVFLDIAFFFKEEAKDYVIKQLNAWCFHGTSGIKVLEDKALITISYDENRIQMHDLIQEMGWEVVRQESTDIGRRSRLRDLEDVLNVLKNNKGTDVVEGMLLDVSQMAEVAFNFDSFKSMSNLRLLKVCFPFSHTMPSFISIQPKYLWNVDLGKLPVDELEKMCQKMIHELFDGYKRWQQEPWDALVTDEGRCMKLLVTRSLSLADDTLEHLEKIRQLPWAEKNSLHWIWMKLYEMWGIINMLQNDDYNVLCDAKIAVSNPNFVSGSNHELTPNNIASAMRALGELMDALTKEGHEVDLKKVDHIFLDGCNVAKESLSLYKKLCILDSSAPRLGISNISGGYFSSLDLPDDQGLHFKTLPDGDKEYHFLRITVYHRLRTINGRDQQEDTAAGEKKRKLLVLFDHFRSSRRVTHTTLRDFVTSTTDFEPFIDPCV